MSTSQTSNGGSSPLPACLFTQIHSNILKYSINYSRPGHTGLYGLITAIARQDLVSRGTDDVVRVDAVFKTSYRRVIDVAGRGKKSERR